MARPFVHIGTKIPPEIYKKIEEIVYRKRTTKSEFVRTAINKYLKEFEEDA